MTLPWSNETLGRNRQSGATRPHLAPMPILHWLTRDEDIQAAARAPLAVGGSEMGSGSAPGKLARNRE